MAKKKFKTVANELIDSIDDALSCYEDSDIYFEAGPDENSGMIGRICTENVNFWVMLALNVDWQYLVVATTCPLAEDCSQSMKELNAANDELVNVKAIYNSEEDAIMLASEANLKTVGEDRYGIATIGCMSSILAAMKKIRNEKLLKGIVPYIKSLDN